MTCPSAQVGVGLGRKAEVQHHKGTPHAEVPRCLPRRPLSRSRLPQGRAGHARVETTGDKSTVRQAVRCSPPPTSRLAFQCVVPSARGSPLRQIEIPRSPARPWCPYAVRWPLQAAPSVLAFVPIDRGETCDTGLRRGRQRSAGQNASYLISTLQRGPVSLAAAVSELTATTKCMTL